MAVIGFLLLCFVEWNALLDKGGGFPVSVTLLDHLMGEEMKCSNG